MDASSGSSEKRACEGGPRADGRHDEHAKGAVDRARSGEKGLSLQVVVPVAALGALLFLALLGSVLALGRQLGDVHPALGAAFYVLTAACVAAGVVYPIVRVLARPLFSLHRLRTGSARSRRRWCGRLAENLQKNADLTADDRAALARIVDADGASGDELAAFFTSRLDPVIDRDIKQAAKAAFAVTAVSQATAYDLLSSLSINAHLVRRIVEDCGYRPSALALVGLYARVFKATFLAAGLEEMDLEELVSLVGGSAVLRVPGVVVASAAQGAANAFATVRVGIITKKVLFAEEAPFDMRRARRESYGEALSFLKDCGLLDDVRALLARAAAGVKDGAVDSAKRAWGRVWRRPDGETDPLP